MGRAIRIRSLAVVVGAALPLLAVPAQAGSSGAGFTDPGNDMPVPSLEVVSGRIQLDAAGQSRTLTMTGTMRGDLTGVPADYDLITGTSQGSTCYWLAARIRWNGVLIQQSYQRTGTFACHGGEVTLDELATLAQEAARFAVGGDPVQATQGGRSVGVTLPAPAWLRTGALAAFDVVSHTPAEGVAEYGVVNVRTYDSAGLDRPWRVG